LGRNKALGWGGPTILLGATRPAAFASVAVGPRARAGEVPTTCSFRCHCLRTASASSVIRRWCSPGSGSESQNGYGLTYGPFLCFSPEIDPGAPLDRPGAPRTSICTKNQPRGPILRLFRGFWVDEEILYFGVVQYYFAAAAPRRVGRWLRCEVITRPAPPGPRPSAPTPAPHIPRPASPPPGPAPPREGRGGVVAEKLANGRAVEGRCVATGREGSVFDRFPAKLGPGLLDTWKPVLNMAASENLRKHTS